MTASRQIISSTSLPFFLLTFLASTSFAYLSRSERERQHPQLFQFPYVGRGDPDHTFRHPYRPSEAGDPVEGWFQLGTAVVSRSHSGRDVLRLTSASQANQGVFYNVIRTESNNFNGYIDIQMDSVRESHEAADGMGFFFVRDRPTIGSAMGIEHTFQGLGIIIDTFSNSRSRSVPYLYAYVSEGTKPWNPDTDGADTEVTRGCPLEMNTPTRIYIQYVDEELHVGVAMNPRHPQRWHTCFKASNVRLPFSNGGYFAFAGETGHFFALHEVHDAVFIDESPHSGEGYHSDYRPQDYGTGDRHGEKHENADKHDAYRPEDHSRSDSQSRSEPEPVLKHQTNPDPASRVHRSTDAHESLSGSLDLQVYEVFNSMSSALQQMGEHDAEDTKLRLDGVREVTSHLIKEMETQKSDMANLIETLKHLKATSGDLAYASDKFTSQLRGFHSSLRALREKAENVVDSHDDMHADLVDHHEFTNSKDGRGNGMLIMFLVIQVLLGAGIYLVNKMQTASRKMGRMV